MTVLLWISLLSLLSLAQSKTACAGDLLVANSGQTDDCEAQSNSDCDSKYRCLGRGMYIQCAVSAEKCRPAGGLCSPSLASLTNSTAGRRDISSPARSGLAPASSQPEAPMWQAGVISLLLRGARRVISLV
mmetsp:Transcript_98643/g.175669  ORF Transcript_98643/g.175669 Transcript_98643/m.175669 type:complete len:131 (-) Transcript_98643:62-454(-)